MNRRIKTLTDIAAVIAVTLVLALALLPMGAEEQSSEKSEEITTTPEEINKPITNDSSSQSTAEPVEAIEVTTTTEETTTTTESQPAASTTAPPQITTTQAAAQAQPSWTEQPASGVKYVNTDGISSVEVAQIGSLKIKRYSLNDAVTVVAITDTDYYKLEDGTFIHADFLSDSETIVTADEETQPPVSETEPENETEPEPETETETETEMDVDVAVDDEEVPLSAQFNIQNKSLEMFNMVNEYRAQYGLAPLQWDYGSSPAAEIRAKELLQRNSHTRPDGSRFSTVFSEVGYYPSSSAENIAYYYSEPRSALNTLINSASHREYILSTKFTHISIAYVYDPNSYWGYYWVQEFTTP